MIYKKNYDDIIDLPHHVSKVHPRMSMIDRAAQFSPFAALTGHSDAVEETARLVDEKLELDETQKISINRKLNLIQDRIKEQPKITITYFLKDKTKTGGAYIISIEKVKKIDDYHHMLLLEDNTKISFEDIYSIELDI